MAASRASSLRPLVKLARTQTRFLHLTGPATYSSPLLTSSRPGVSMAQDIKDAASDIAKRPSAESISTPPTTSRQFNTSRAMKTVNDTSSIDFMYFPDFDPDTGFETRPSIRVPLLPTTQNPTSFVAEQEEAVMRPTISLVSADSTHITAPSAFAEIHDNNATDIDFSKLAHGLNAATKPADAPEVGPVKQVWSGLLDDIFGSSSPAKRT